jgi:hypothetical protein
MEFSQQYSTKPIRNLQTADGSDFDIGSVQDGYLWPEGNPQP